MLNPTVQEQKQEVVREDVTECERAETELNRLDVNGVSRSACWSLSVCPHLSVLRKLRQQNNVACLPEPAAECPTSPESLTLDMEDQEEEELCVVSLPQRRTKTREPQNRMKPNGEAQRPKPPD